MSIPAKLTLCSSIVISVGIVSYVHLKQQDDRDRLHDGVIKDVERQQMRKLENTYALAQQVDLAKKLQKHLDSTSS